MKHLFSVVTIIGGLIGALILFFAFAATDSAPRQGSLAAIAVGFAVIPYCITRAIHLLTDKKEEILRSVASDIRRGTLGTQPSTVPIHQEAEPQSESAAPGVASTKRETIEEYKERMAREKSGESQDAFAKTEVCPSCSEMNFRDAKVCFSCGSVMPNNVKAEPASWLG